jgi:hypothetical protein
MFLPFENFIAFKYSLFANSSFLSRLYNIPLITVISSESPFFLIAESNIVNPKLGSVKPISCAYLFANSICLLFLGT